MLSQLFNFIVTLPLLTIHFMDIIVHLLLRLFRISVDHQSYDLQKPYRRNEMKAKPTKDNPLIYRSVSAMDRLLETPVEKVETMSQLLDHVVQQYGEKNAMGKRNLLEMRKKATKDPNKFWDIAHFDDKIEWITYEQMGQTVDKLADGLLKSTDLKSGEKIMLYENTSTEWMLLTHACFKANIVIATVYANLGVDALISAVNETESSAIFINLSSASELIKRLADECQTLKFVILSCNFIPEKDKNDQMNAINKDQTRLTIIHFDELMKNKNQNHDNKQKADKTDSNSLAMIMYTSGTTGRPKGVALTHRNILSCIAGLNSIIGDDPSVEYHFLGYLPLAHILEFVAEHVILVKGGSIGYGTPRTLTSSGATPSGDLEAFSPQVLIGVPKMFETIRKSAVEKLKKSGRIAQFIFQQAITFKLRAIKKCRSTPVWDRLLFNRFKSLIGGNVKVMLSGGATLNKESQEFIRACFGATFLQGYGLTEVAGAVCIQGVFDPFETGVVGAPIPCCEIQLVSHKDMGYTIEDKPYPRGELIVRGNNVSSGGYYKQEDLTNEAFKDGWFYTGDIAQIRSDGSVQIIDRKKNLVKLSGGEYVAVERLESLYASAQCVSQVMIYADSHLDNPIALVIPNFKVLQQWAKDNNVKKSNKDELCKNEKAVQYVMKEMNAKGPDLKSFEKVRNIRLINDEWTTENECLTAAQKVKRNVIEKRHKALIDQMSSSDS